MTWSALIPIYFDRMGDLLANVAMGADHWAWVAVGRLATAALLGGLIGIEREHHGRSAGFRTQMLVALGSAVAMVVSLHFGQIYGDMPDSSAVRVDPARVAYGVMGGIGFLGAGAIIRYGTGIRGLTTAASLWCTAAMGLACGFGMYLVAVVATGIVIFTLLALSKLDRAIPSKKYKTVIVFLPASGQDNVARLSDLLRAHRARIVSVEYKRDVPQSLETITFHIRIPSNVSVADLTHLDEQVPEILKLSIV